MRTDRADRRDPLTASLGYQHPDQLENTLAIILSKIIEDKPLEPGEGIIHQEEGVDLLPANIDLAAMDVTLVNIMSRETILREYLNTVRDQYEVILLDCYKGGGFVFGSRHVRVIEAVVDQRPSGLVKQIMDGGIILFQKRPCWCILRSGLFLNISNVF